MGLENNIIYANKILLDAQRARGFTDGLFRVLYVRWDGAKNGEQQWLRLQPLIELVCVFEVFGVVWICRGNRRHNHGHQ